MDLCDSITHIRQGCFTDIGEMMTVPVAVLEGVEEKHFDGLVLDCSISSALAMEILQSCTKPLI